MKSLITVLSFTFIFSSFIFFQILDKWIPRTINCDASSEKPRDGLQMQTIVGTSTPLKFMVHSPPSSPLLFSSFFPPSPHLYLPVHAPTTLIHPRPFPSGPYTPSTYSIKLVTQRTSMTTLFYTGQKTHRSNKITLRGCWPGGLLLDAETTDVITRAKDSVFPQTC